MLLGAARRDCEDLRREIATASLLESPLCLEEGAVIFESAPQLGDSLAAQRIGQHDRRLPLASVIEREHRPELRGHRARRRMIRLVDRDHVGDLHDPRLERLDGVTGSRHEDEKHRIRDRDHLDLALARPDRFQEDEVLARRVEKQHRLERRLREATEMAAGAHRADVDAGIEEVLGESDPVAEQRSLRERARRVDRDDPDREPALSDQADEGSDQ